MAGLNGDGRPDIVMAGKTGTRDSAEQQAKKKKAPMTIHCGETWLQDYKADERVGAAGLSIERSHDTDIRISGGKTRSHRYGPAEPL